MPGADQAGRPRRTRLTAEQRRETILEAATEVFAASGYRAGKVSDVAARIGVTEPVIFQNFGSKATLFAAVLDRLAGDVRTSLDSLAGRHEPVASLLARILSPAGTGAGLSAGLASAPAAPAAPAGAGAGHGPGAHRTLFADAASLVADPEAGEAATRAARALAGHLADLVRRGQQDGSVRADVNPAAAGWLLLSVLSTRPLRAGAMAGAGLEADVDGLALRAIVTPAALPLANDHPGPNIACRAAAPAGVELTRMTSSPPARRTSHRAHAQQRPSTETSSRSSRSTAAPPANRSSRPSAVSARPRPASRASRSHRRAWIAPCAAPRSQAMSGARPGTVPSLVPSVASTLSSLDRGPCYRAS
jgi:AcrR family transcriptional regulator